MGMAASVILYMIMHFTGIIIGALAYKAFVYHICTNLRTHEVLKLRNQKSAHTIVIYPNAFRFIAIKPPA